MVVLCKQIPLIFTPNLLDMNQNGSYIHGNIIPALALDPDRVAQHL